MLAQEAARPRCPGLAESVLRDAEHKGESVTDVANETLPPEILTVPELASLLRLKTKSVYALLSRNSEAIPGCRKVGGAWRAHRATVVAWLAGQNSDARQRSRGVR
jgi:hypothetical protein